MLDHPRSRLVLALTAVPLLVVLLGACSGGGSKTPDRTAPAARSTASGTPADPNATGAKDPCSYVSGPEVQSATGKTVSGDPIRINDFVCRYNTSEGVINVGVSRPVTRERFDQGVQANANGQQLTMIADLGDEAFAVPFGVSVFKGSASISIAVSPSSAPTGGDAAITLARLVLQRL